MNPADFTGSPGYFSHDGVLYQLADDNWNVDIEIVKVERRSNIRGRLGDWEEYVKSTVKAKPIALLASLATQLTKLIPRRPQQRGQRIRSNTDKPLVIQSTDGRSVTFTSAVLTKMPPLQFAPNKDFFGEVEFTCLRKAGAADTATDGHVVEASSAYTEPLLDPGDILSSKFTLAMGDASPLDDIECDEDGVTFTVDAKLKELMTWNNGLLNYQIDDVTASIKFKPQNLAQADLLNTLLQTDGANAGRGRRLGDRGLSLTVAGGVGDPSLTIPLAVCSAGGLVYGSDRRLKEVTLMAEETLNGDGDAWEELFTIEVPA